MADNNYLNRLGEKRIKTSLLYETSGVRIPVSDWLFKETTELAIAWFICGYKTKSNRPKMRYCAMDDFTRLIFSEGGSWSESEVLGGYAIVKVKASVTTLATIADTPGYHRIEGHWALNDTLNNLTVSQITMLTNKILAMGYTQSEIDTAMGTTPASWQQKTLAQLLQFISQRRLKPRWDAENKRIVLDGTQQSCKPVVDVDIEVT